jgi:hypothetical protein
MGRFLVGLALLAALAGAAWHFRQEIEASVRTLTADRPATTPIAEIVGAPQRFDGKAVTITGTVSGTSEISFAGAAPSRSYTLRDGKAEIVVEARGGLPARGQVVTVTGTASRPPGRGLAPRVAETKRESGG